MDQAVSTEATHVALDLMAAFRPHRIEGCRKTRLGQPYDGGYVMLDDFDGIEAAYSLGINDDVSWDLDIAARGIPVFQYDHTISRLPAEHPLFRWERTGIDSVADPARSLDTIPNLLRKNGHEGRRNLLLKCDIEGPEWRVFSCLPADVARQFRQIVVEVHALQDLGQPHFADVACRAAWRLADTHRVVHVHANNFANWTVIGGVPIPEVLEICFVRLDRGAFTVSDEVFPTALDMPCDPRRADLYLGRFAYDRPGFPGAPAITTPRTPHAAAGKPVGALLSTALRSALMRCARAGSSIQDRIDCAELLSDAGIGAAAEIMRSVALLQSGLARSTGQGPSRSTTGTAIAELAQAAAKVRDLPPLPQRAQDIALPEAGLSQDQAPAGRYLDLGAGGAAHVAALCRRLCVALHCPPSTPALAELGTVLAELRIGVLDGPAFDAGQHVAAGLEVLGVGVAIDLLRRHLAANLDLADGPFGSVGLFHAAASCETAGLGPCFTNAGRIVRGGRDVLGLIQLALDEGAGAACGRDALERWSYLLSQHASDALLVDLVHELGDRGLMRAVRAICARMAGRAGKDPGLPWAIRDAALDNGDLQLASRAQRLVLRNRAGVVDEWIVQGEIEATAGNRAGAEEAFASALDLEPLHRGVLERLEALRQDGFEPFLAVSGYATPRSRKLLRLRRRKAEEAALTA